MSLHKGCHEPCRGGAESSGGLEDGIWIIHATDNLHSVASTLGSLEAPTCLSCLSMDPSWGPWVGSFEKDRLKIMTLDNGHHKRQTTVKLNYFPAVDTVETLVTVSTVQLPIKIVTTELVTSE